MKSIVKHLMNINYPNTVILVSVSLIALVIHSIIPINKHIISFLIVLMFIVMIFSPIARFKSIIFGRNRVLFLTPNSYKTIFIGYLISEVLIFITYSIGIGICSMDFYGQESFLNQILGINIYSMGLSKYLMYIFIKMFDIWFFFTSVGIISVVLSRKNIIKKIKFVSIKIFINFIIIIFILLFVTVIIDNLVIAMIIRFLVSVYMLYISYKKILNLDIY